jgi:hypothetical protein
VRKRYSTYDLENYVVIQAPKHWRHYFPLKEVVLYMDHQALKFLNSPTNLNVNHMICIEFMSKYIFLLNTSHVKRISH